MGLFDFIMPDKTRCKGNNKAPTVDCPGASESTNKTTAVNTIIGNSQHNTHHCLSISSLFIHYSSSSFFFKLRPMPHWKASTTFELLSVFIIKYRLSFFCHSSFYTSKYTFEIFWCMYILNQLKILCCLYFFKIEKKKLFARHIQDEFDFLLFF